MNVQGEDQIHILLAEDDDDDHLFFREAIQQSRLPIKLSHTEDGQKLLDFLEKGDLPDVLFLDINMPNIDGLEALKQIRTKPKYNNLPIVVFSTRGFKSTIDSCFSYGADIFVVKPNSFQDLIGVIKKFCHKDWKSNFSTTRPEYYQSQSSTVEMYAAKTFKKA